VIALRCGEVVVADRDIPEETEKAIERVAHEVYEAWRVTANRDAYVADAICAAASQAVSAALAGRQVVPATEPGEMPPVPCPDCMHPTEHDGGLFHCTGCGQAFSTPNGMDLSMWQELWRAWTAGRQVVDLPAEPVDELAARILVDHMLTGPSPGQCRCGWGQDPRHLGLLHSRHVVEQLRAAGVLAAGSGSGED
jgi:hypothetical protein